MFTKVHERSKIKNKVDWSILKKVINYPITSKKITENDDSISEYNN
jgi:hypothetical protein